MTDIASELIYPELGDDVEQVLRTLVFKEKTVAARDGRWFTMRIMPYRTLDNRIDGVVITFVDISAAKKLENVLNSARDGAHVFIDALPQAFGVFEAALDENGGLSGTRLVFANRALKHFLKKEEAQIAGKTLDAVYPDLAPGWEKPVARVVAGGAPERFEISAQPGGRPVVCSVYRPGDLAGQFCVVFSEPVDPEGL